MPEGYKKYFLILISENIFDYFKKEKTKRSPDVLIMILKS